MVLPSSTRQLKSIGRSLEEEEGDPLPEIPRFLAGLGVKRGDVATRTGASALVALPSGAYREVE